MFKDGKTKLDFSSARLEDDGGRPMENLKLADDRLDQGR